MVYALEDSLWLLLSISRAIIEYEIDNRVTSGSSYYPWYWVNMEEYPKLLKHQKLGGETWQSWNLNSEEEVLPICCWYPERVCWDWL